MPGRRHQWALPFNAGSTIYSLPAAAAAAIQSMYIAVAITIFITRPLSRMKNGYIWYITLAGLTHIMYCYFAVKLKSVSIPRSQWVVGVQYYCQGGSRWKFLGPGPHRLNFINTGSDCWQFKSKQNNYSDHKSICTLHCVINKKLTR